MQIDRCRSRGLQQATGLRQRRIVGGLTHGQSHAIGGGCTDQGRPPNPHNTNCFCSILNPSKGPDDEMMGQFGLVDDAYRAAVISKPD